jgi:transcriptional regulator with XRE-family HTH domain
LPIPSIVSEAFGQHLKALRRGRKQNEFAAFLGLKAPTYLRYERGRVPKKETLSVIAERCGVTVRWLLGVEPDSASEAMHGPAKPGSSDMAVRDAARRPFVYPDANDQRPCPRPEDCAFDARLKAIEGAQARMEAQLSTLTQLLGATLAASSRNGAAPESERKAG